MSIYTDRGLQEIGGGMREALALVRRRKSDLLTKMGALEVEIAELSKIEGAIGGAAEVLRNEQKAREAAK